MKLSQDMLDVIEELGLTEKVAEKCFADISVRRIHEESLAETMSYVIGNPDFSLGHVALYSFLLGELNGFLISKGLRE